MHLLLLALRDFVISFNLAKNFTLQKSLTFFRSEYGNFLQINFWTLPIGSDTFLGDRCICKHTALNVNYKIAMYNWLDGRDEALFDCTRAHKLALHQRYFNIVEAQCGLLALPHSLPWHGPENKKKHCLSLQLGCFSLKNFLTLGSL